MTIEDIKSFEESYKGSEEEKETLKSAYVDSEGNMDSILEEVLFSRDHFYSSVDYLRVDTKLNHIHTFVHTIHIIC